MSKYKLKKTYPGSENLNTVVKEFTGGYMSNDLIFYYKDQIESFTDFWELIKEKEWEVLEGITSVKISSVTTTSSHKIYKIKRLSDGEIFTVGDKCNLSNGNGNRNPILRFEVRNESFGLEKYRNKDRIVVFLETMHKTEWGPIELDSLVKSKEPLFITEDKIEIFEGDSCWQVRDACGVLLSESNKITNITSNNTWNNCKYLFFKTEEKAQAYINLNKPQYSKKDIIESCFECGYSGIVGNITYRLKEKHK